MLIPGDDLIDERRADQSRRLPTWALVLIAVVLTGIAGWSLA